MNIRVVIVQSIDFLALSKLGRETFYETWKDYNSEEDMKIYLKDAFNPDKIQKELLDKDCNTFLFAYVDDALAGYAKLRRDRTYDEFKGSKTIEMERIYVKKEFQRTGIGRALMDRCLEIANTEKHEWFWLGVNIDNHKAIAFYKQYRFEIFGSKMFKLGEAEDEDYLMKKQL